MPSGVYIRTEEHKKAISKGLLGNQNTKGKSWTHSEKSRRNMSISQKSKPRSEAQMACLAKLSELPRTKKQLEAVSENIKKAQKLPRTKKQINNILYLSKLPRSEAQMNHARNLGKAATKEKLICHHKNGNHFDDNQFNLLVISRSHHATIHGKLKRNYHCNYTEIALEVKLQTEMYYGD